MFIPSLKIGEVISNARLMSEFNVANMGGMRYSKTYDVLVLISNHWLKRNNPNLNPFDDEWIDDVLYYTGMGNLGDQPKPPHSQNKRLYYQKYSGLYLFEVFDKKNNEQLYTYQGPVELAGAPMYGDRHPNGIQPDSNGNYRKVWIFPIKKLG